MPTSVSSGAQLRIFLPGDTVQALGESGTIPREYLVRENDPVMVVIGPAPRRVVSYPARVLSLVSTGETTPLLAAVINRCRSLLEKSRVVTVRSQDGYVLTVSRPVEDDDEVPTSLDDSPHAEVEE